MATGGGTPETTAQTTKRTARRSRSRAGTGTCPQTTGPPARWRSDAEEELVDRHLALADSLARRYRHTSEPLDDLVQVARLGLVKATRRWDPARGAAFSTYAVPTILGELRRHFRDKTWVVRVPRNVQELYMAVQGERERLWQELGREPTANDVAERLGRPVEDIVDALEAGNGYAPYSLDVPANETDGGGTRQDFLEDPRDPFGDSENAAMLEQLASEREIGERVGCSQMHVSRILRDGIRRLQARARTGG